MFFGLNIHKVIGMVLHECSKKFEFKKDTIAELHFISHDKGFV